MGIFVLAVTLTHPFLLDAMNARIVGRRGGGLAGLVVALPLLIPFRWLLWRRLESALGAVGGLLGFWSVVMVVVTVALGAVGTGLIVDEGERTGALVGAFITFGMIIWTSYTVMTER